MGCAKGSCSHICQNWNSALVLKMSQRTLSIATGCQIGETHLKRSVDYDIKALTSLTIQRIMGTGQKASVPDTAFVTIIMVNKRMIGRKSQHVVSASFSLRKGWFWRELLKTIWTMFYKFLISLGLVSFTGSVLILCPGFCLHKWGENCNVFFFSSVA